MSHRIATAATVAALAAGALASGAQPAAAQDPLEDFQREGCVYSPSAMNAVKVVVCRVLTAVDVSG